MSHADIMYAAKSISCGSVLRYSLSKRDSVSHVARGLISANRSRRKPFPLSCMPRSRLLPEVSPEFQSCPPPPSSHTLCIWQTPANIYIHNKQWTHKEKREWYRITPAVWLRRQTPLCWPRCDVLLADFPHKPRQAGWMEESLQQSSKPSASSLQQHGQLQTRCGKSPGIRPPWLE